ncbi:MAG: hypothetical protein KH281_13290, partial [Lachnospiraceae bacterium]|nr:hypothetical protein [Lachnospiraceae bacterium]
GSALVIVWLSFGSALVIVWLSFGSALVIVWLSFGSALVIGLPPLVPFSYRLILASICAFAIMYIAVVTPFPSGIFP